MLLAGFKIKSSPSIGGIRIKTIDKKINETALKHFVEKFDKIDEDEHTRIKNLPQHFNDDDQTTK